VIRLFLPFLSFHIGVHMPLILTVPLAQKDAPGLTPFPSPSNLSVCFCLRAALEHNNQLKQNYNPLSFGAEKSEMQEYMVFIDRYLELNVKSANSYLVYCSLITSLPQLVTALVLLYGGMLVQTNQITAGELVSFLLYLSSLSDAFNSMGSIFSSLTSAVGAADKVFELCIGNPK